MSTNRTKIDWAYKQAQKIMAMGESSAPMERNDLIRAIAAILRLAKRRGERAARAD